LLSLSLSALLFGRKWAEPAKQFLASFGAHLNVKTCLVVVAIALVVAVVVGVVAVVAVVAARPS